MRCQGPQSLVAGGPSNSKILEIFRRMFTLEAKVDEIMRIMSQ
jgi:hypothetical protein